MLKQFDRMHLLTNTTEQNIMTMDQYLYDLKKEAYAEYEKGNFWKGEALMERYLDEADSYEKLKRRLAA